MEIITYWMAPLSFRTAQQESAFAIPAEVGIQLGTGTFFVFEKGASPLSRAGFRLSRAPARSAGMTQEVPNAFLTQYATELMIFRARQRIRHGFLERGRPLPLVGRAAATVGADLIHGGVDLDFESSGS
jgi:hypothetical protein